MNPRYGTAAEGWTPPGRKTPKYLGVVFIDQMKRYAAPDGLVCKDRESAKTYRTASDAYDAARAAVDTMRAADRSRMPWDEFEAIRRHAAELAACYRPGESSPLLAATLRLVESLADACLTASRRAENAHDAFRGHHHAGSALVVRS